MLGMENATFILGDCPTGLDAIAKSICEKFDLKYELFVADWSTHASCYCRDKNVSCRNAGPVRNQRMVDSRPTVGFAFRNEGPSAGTDDCIRRCFQAGVPIYRILPTTANTEGVTTFTGLRKNKYNSLLEG